MNLYITADKVGTWTGGGSVTQHESHALSKLGNTIIIDNIQGVDPFDTDKQILDQVAHRVIFKPTIAHLYAGCLTETVKKLKELGAKVFYTAAAHSIEASRKEHEKWGYGFPYPHLTDPQLWAKYVEGYLLADTVICPSTNSKRVMESYGCKNVMVISHGVDIPDSIKPYPKRFTVGYLGACGADKGLPYLFQAWKKLDYKDSTLLLAGSQWEGMLSLARQHGGGNIHVLGFVDHIGEFFNQISCYVQSSVSEGFGIEVLEAFAYGRYPIVSQGAGAIDVLRAYQPNMNDLDNGSFSPGDVNTLCEKIKILKQAHDDYVAKPGFEQDQETLQKELRDHARKYSWDKIEDLYLAAWKAV